jgi:hypothetical protein
VLDLEVPRVGHRVGNLDTYMERLVTAFDPAAAAAVMCRNTISVGWDGLL